MKLSYISVNIYEEVFMTIKLQIYKCSICGNIVQILDEGDGNLICCGQEMNLMQIQYDTDELGEKHTPKVILENDKQLVNVIGHPMNKEHYIQFIETYTRDKNELHIKFFKPNEIPQMDISFFKGKNINSIEYCNIHNLWGDNIMLQNETGSYSI